MSDKYQMGERVISLLGVIRRPQGVSRAEARKIIAAYKEYTDDTFRRTFERDLSLLRSLGYPITTQGSTYHYDTSAPLITSLNWLDVGLLSSVLNHMDLQGNHEQKEILASARLGMAKMLAGSSVEKEAPRYLKASIPEGEEILNCAAALQTRTRISFDYLAPELRTYELEPANISVHFQAFYVSGWSRRVSPAPSADASHAAEKESTSGEKLTAEKKNSTEEQKDQENHSPAHSPQSPDNQWKVRTFRISRVISGSLATIKPASLEPPQLEDSVFLAHDAVIAVRPGSVVPFVGAGEPCASLKGTPEGWQCVRLKEVNRQHLFESLVDYCDDLLLVGDSDLVEDWRTRVNHLACLGADKS